MILQRHGACIINILQRVSHANIIFLLKKLGSSGRQWLIAVSAISSLWTFARQHCQKDPFQTKENTSPTFCGKILKTGRRGCFTILCSWSNNACYLMFNDKEHFCSMPTDKASNSSLEEFLWLWRCHVQIFQFKVVQIAANPEKLKNRSDLNGANPDLKYCTWSVKRRICFTKRGKWESRFSQAHNKVTVCVKTHFLKKLDVFSLVSQGENEILLCQDEVQW